MPAPSSPSMSKGQLLRVLGEGLGAQGYQPVAASRTCFFKPAGDLLLTLGVELSKLYQARFTASFYLGPTFEWGYMLPDYPRRAYQRLGAFLGPEARARLLEPEFTEPGVVDAWWTGYTDERAARFLEAVRIAEPAFLAQPGLTGEIDASADMKRHQALVARTRALVPGLAAPPEGLRHQPQRTRREIPPVWYRAAEGALTELADDAVVPTWVALVAEDAWRLAALAEGIGSK